MPTRRRFLALVPAALALSGLPATAASTRVTGGGAFGSYWRLTLPAEVDAAAAMRAIEAIVADVDAVFSPWRDDSELSRFNRHRDRAPVPLSPSCKTVVEAALRVARRSGGAFDPTVGPAVARLGFGPIADGEAGDHSMLALGPRGLSKARPRLSLDLCGIAKGYALDRMAEALDRLRLGSWLLDLGGEVIARGRHPEGRRWRLAVEPGAMAGATPPVLALEDEAVATSGTLHQGYDVAGRRAGHIIDPSRNSSADTDAVAVSVVAADATTADAWATALMALPAGNAVALAEANGLDALFLLRNGGPERRVTTGRFADRLLA